jgi:hypothetical protein
MHLEREGRGPYCAGVGHLGGAVWWLAWGAIGVHCKDMSYPDLLYRIIIAPVVVGGLNNSDTVNWRKYLAVNPDFHRWAEARGVGREDLEFGTARGRRFYNIFVKQLGVSRQAVGMAGR